MHHFNKGTIKHYFCPSCGLGIFGMGLGIVVVDVRCVEGVDLDKLELMKYDGKNLVLEHPSQEVLDWNI